MTIGRLSFGIRKGGTNKFRWFYVLSEKEYPEKGLFSLGGLVANGILLYQRRKAVRGDGKVLEI